MTRNEEADAYVQQQWLEEVDEVLKLRDLYEETRRTRAFDFYEPYPFQLRFHEARDDQGNRACLLYTSPSPRDKRQSRMPSSA